MAEQADVYVKNLCTDDIQAARYCLPGDNKDLDISITNGNQEMVFLVRTETYLVIKPPSGVITQSCLFSVSNEELLSWETMDDQWKVEIKDNTLLPEAPTTVNVDVGPNET